MSNESITEFGSTEASGLKSTIAFMTIVGQIEGHQLLSDDIKTTKYEHILPQLAEIEESDSIGGVLIMINTVGGDTEAGMAIAELVSGMKTPAATLVLGGGHSIGVPLAVAAGRSFIVPSAAITIHPVRMNGVMIGVPQTYNYLARIQERITKFVVANSRISESRLTELMFNSGELAADVGSVLYGTEAVKEGLIDELGGIKEALAWLHNEIEKH